ncbi:clusterin [Carcharodon carcharias]|uniref:clusterin n=1 Tax=Carcharodon carcharias TaxID=13397 RepID=UPI001B7DAE76|nr:clusterin [Carcharodon carcharias]XP_041043930.1 clusterin [Carcharodon carcharias]XP_041043931.1 clusterin [Carcharodon carcharias]XP_041043932.1 clusterin [Carcharodon carcharias]
MKNIMFTVWLVLVLAVSESWQQIPPEKLKKLSIDGQKYLNKQIENAISGAKIMKSIADKSDQQHQEYLRSLEQTSKQKEEALVAAKDAQRKLTDAEQCQSKEALWEDCKPCLKQTCTQFYSRVCRRGFGLVEKDVERFFNETPLASVWVNGDKFDSLVEKNAEQGEQFEHVEKQYEDIDEMFRESMRAFDGTDRLIDHPFSNFGLFPKHFSLFPDSSLSPFKPSMFDSHGMLSSFFDMTQRMFEKFHKIMHDVELDRGMYHEIDGQNRTNSTEGQDQFICREIRRNSSGCMKLSDKCEKCKELMSLECFDMDHKPLRKAFEEALSMAEHFTKKYDNLMKEFQQKMENSTKELEMLNKQFGWVSKLANYTQSPDGSFHVKAILSRSANDGPSKDTGTTVTVQIFDSPPLTFMVPGQMHWEDPEFSEMLAQQALKHYNENRMLQGLPDHKLETIEA